MLTTEQANAILTRFQSAAPPSAADKLRDVMVLLSEMDAEIARLKGALEAARAEPERPAGGARRNGSERSVTDQLADIFDVITTTETDTSTFAPVSEAPADLHWQMRVDEDVPGGANIMDSSIAQPPDPADPLNWLKQALPQLLLSDEEEEKLQAEVRQATSRLQTTPILDLLTPLQESLRPAMLLVRAQAERLQSGKMGRLTTEQSVAVRSIREHADSALSLVDSVGQILAVQQGRLRVDLSKFDCAEMVDRAIRMMQMSADARAHQLVFSKPSEPLLVYADLEISLMILIDLLDNAIRYTPNGGVIRVSIDSLGSHLLLNVADSGIGLNESDFASVGKPFWRAIHHPLVYDNPGSGLRLYLAQRLLSLQNGELIFSGEPGVGSTFSFTLPAVQEV